MKLSSVKSHTVLQLGANENNCQSNKLKAKMNTAGFLSQIGSSEQIGASAHLCAPFSLKWNIGEYCLFWQVEFPGASLLAVCRAI